jgi:hypothetical protein
VRDLFSGCYAVRLATLKRSFPDHERALQTDGWCANAELVARSAAQARQIAVVPVPAARGPRRSPPLSASALALAMLRAGRRLRIPAPTAVVERMA